MSEAERAPQDVEAAWERWFQNLNPSMSYPTPPPNTMFRAGWEAHAAATAGAVVLTADEAELVAGFIQGNTDWPRLRVIAAKLRAALDALGGAEHS